MRNGTSFLNLINEVLRTLAITQEEIEDRKRYLELVESDIDTLKKLQPSLASVHDKLMDEFYDHLLAFNETASFLNDAEAIQTLKQKQSDYFADLISGQYDWDYVLDRLRVGVAHHQIGLEPRWYFGAYSKYLCSLLPQDRKSVV